MEQHILKHNEHYLGEICTRNNLSAAILNNVCFFIWKRKRLSVVKDIMFCSILRGVSIQFHYCNNEDQSQITFLYHSTRKKNMHFVVKTVLAI